jgi:hypothetical protein
MLAATLLEVMIFQSGLKDLVLVCRHRTLHFFQFLLNPLRFFRRPRRVRLLHEYRAFSCNFTYRPIVMDSILTPSEEFNGPERQFLLPLSVHNG